MAERNRTLRFLHHWPTRIVCLFFLVVQSVSLNWYLMTNLSYTWASIFGLDAFVFYLFVCAMVMAATNIHEEKRLTRVTFDDVRYLPLTCVAWFMYAIALDVKLAVVFTKFSTDLSEDVFFGPNTMKTTLALTAVIFLSFLASQHDLRNGDRKELMFSVTGIVIFDILDGVDNLDNLFEAEVRDAYPPGLADTVIAICCINFLLAGVPLLTLTVAKFGLRKVPERLELFHKMAIAYAVNLTLFITRMITWHGFSQGISIFVIKNLLVMGATLFELLEHYFNEEKEEEEKKEVARRSSQVVASNVHLNNDTSGH